TVLIPTTRNKVLFPDIFDPLTRSTRVCASSLTLFRTHFSPAISGCPSSSPSKNPSPSSALRNSGKGSAGCSYEYAARESSASISPVNSAHRRNYAPQRSLQASAATPTCTLKRNGSSDTFASTPSLASIQ